jgi:hypothetical protein
MAPKPRLVLTDEHRLAVERGETTVAAIADAQGIGRPAAWRAFKRRGWPTKPAAPDGTAPAATAPGPPDLAEPPTARAAARRLGLDLDDQAGLGSVLKANLIVGNAELIGRVNAALSRPDQLGPVALKSLGQALAAARGELERLDVLEAADAAASPAVMQIRQLSDQEADAIQAAASAEHAGLFADDEPAGADEPDEQHREEGPAQPERGPLDADQRSGRGDLPHAPGALPGASRAPAADADELRRRLDALARRSGARGVRMLVVVLGLEPRQSGQEMIQLLLSYAQSDPAFGTKLDHELRRQDA